MKNILLHPAGLPPSMSFLRWPASSCGITAPLSRAWSKAVPDHSQRRKI